ncbi:MAG: polysaccharide pyruvyl transferase family protein [Bacillota bacterium]
MINSKIFRIFKIEGFIGIYKRIGARISIIAYIIPNYISKLFYRKFYFHYGLWGRANAGDTVLFEEVENTFNIYLKKNRWFIRSLHKGEITQEDVDFINKRGKALILGGGGLILADTNRNENSGWQFNISIENLKKIRIPIIVFAIGYNKFRNQSEFIPIFNEHISTLIQKSIFFGLRNYGSIEAIKNYIPEELHEKVKLQPCPTNILTYLKPKYKSPFNSSKFKRIAICIALDRFEMRFGKNSELFFNNLLEFSKCLRGKGLTVDYVIHLASEMEHPLIKRIEANGFKIVRLYISSVKHVLSYYSKVSFVFGMRGHSLMIPYGLGVPIISLTTHLKQSWFLETIGHPEWGIDVLDENFINKLEKNFNEMNTNYAHIKKEILGSQKLLYNLTTNNMNTIIKQIEPNNGHRNF